MSSAAASWGPGSPRSAPGPATTSSSARSTTPPPRSRSSGCIAVARPGRARAASSPTPTATPPLARLRSPPTLGDLADRDVVVEAVVEDEKAKIGGLPRAGRRSSRPTCLLASNTSSIPIMKLAVGHRTARSGCIGLHFFNPVPVLPLVELVAEPAHRRRRRCAARRGVRRASGLGKQTVLLQGPGRLRGQRPADPVPAGRHPDGRVRVRHRRGRRHRRWSPAAPTRWARWRWPT